MTHREWKTNFLTTRKVILTLSFDASCSRSSSWLQSRKLNSSFCRKSALSSKLNLASTQYTKKRKIRQRHTWKNGKWLEWLRGTVQWIQRINLQCPPASSANGLISTCQYLTYIFRFDYSSFSIFTTFWSLFLSYRFLQNRSRTSVEKDPRPFCETYRGGVVFNKYIWKKNEKMNTGKVFLVMWDSSFLTKPVMKNSYHKVWPSCQLLGRTSLQSPLPGRI